MLLLIDTSQEKGVVAVAAGEKVIQFEENFVPREHASWLHLAVNRVLAGAGITMRDLQAVAVVAGPGSYTGLRVGMAAAKGYCYGLKIPLITLNTLRVMAESVRDTAINEQALICPMIDARRDEVFTAMYSVENESPNEEPSTVNRQSTNDRQPSTVNRQPSTVNRQPTAPLHEIVPPQALILDKNAFEPQLSHSSVIFFGTGAEKWEKLNSSPRAIFVLQPDMIQSLATLAHQEFKSSNWADTIYSEPVYLKEFFTY